MQNIIKAAKAQGLATAIKENELVAELVRAICALPLLRTDDIEEGLASIGRASVRAGLYDLLKPLFIKVASTWLSPRVLEVLSVHGARDRTSNACESDNRTLQRTVRNAHPNMWRFLSKFELCRRNK